MKRPSFSRYILVPLGISLLVVSPSLFADGGANHQVSSDFYGVSGGNVNDRSRSFCCSGTLGSLVTDGTRNYILSNNHVLARSNQAAIGEDISQPGMIDLGCRVNEIVADLTAFPNLLNSNVDAAIAELRAGAMSAGGEILDIGQIGTTVATPSVGLGVQKSGRTTGHTTASIGSVNTNVNVQYQAGCGGGKKFTVGFTGQIVINSSTFSAGGDSGSLIVTTGSCPLPVGLLYAGSSSTTIANPIGEVLVKVSAALGRTVSFVGRTCSASAARVEGSLPELSQDVVDRTSRIKDRNVRRLMSRPGVMGVGVGASDLAPDQAAIVIYVDQTAGVQPRLPRRIDGVPVKVVYTDPFVAY